MEPIVLISKHRIREGKLGQLRQYTREALPVIEASKPGTVFQCAYANQDGSEVSFVHVFPNAAAMEDHLVGSGDRADKAYELIEPISMEIFGSPGEKVLQMFIQFEARGITFALRPESLGGFIRLSAVG